MPSSSCRWIAVCAASLWLTACDDGAGADTPNPAAAQPKAPVAVQPELAPELVAAVSSPRNSAVVGVHFALKGSPIVGKALPVDVVIVPHATLAAVSAYFEARDGLSLATGNVLERQADPKPEKKISHQLVLLPSREGVFMLTAGVETEGSDGTVTRVFSMPIIVSPAPGAPSAPAAAPTPATEPAPAAGS